MNKRRLLKLADFIAALPRRKLNMGVITQLRGSAEMNPFACKSVACAMGWTPAAFPRLARWKRLDTANPDVMVEQCSNYLAMRVLFDIDREEAGRLFGAGKPGYRTPKEVAKGIRHFAETGELP